MPCPGLLGGLVLEKAESAQALFRAHFCRNWSWQPYHARFNLGYRAARALILLTETSAFSRFANLLEEWHAPGGARRFCAPALVTLLFAAVALIVYLTGGTKFAHAHLFYLPILLSAFCFGLPGGIAGGLRPV